MATVADQIPENQLVPVAVDDRTAGGIPLPHPSNSAKRDVVRIRAAFLIIQGFLDVLVDEKSVRAIIAEVIDAAPATLDTLNELAAALGDDPNFSNTVMTAIGERATKAEFSSALRDVNAGIAGALVRGRRSAFFYSKVMR